MRWTQQTDWGPARLGSDEWAPLQAQIASKQLDDVEQVLEELTGFMDFFRGEVAGEKGAAPLTGVTDGQLAVVHGQQTDTWGRQVLRVTFYAAGPVGESSPDAFARLAKAAGSLVDGLQAEGVPVEGIHWKELPYVKRPF